MTGEYLKVAICAYADMDADQIVLLDLAVVEVKYSACNLVWRSAFQRQRN